MTIESTMSPAVVPFSIEIVVKFCLQDSFFSISMKPTLTSSRDFSIHRALVYVDAKESALEDVYEVLVMIVVHSMGVGLITFCFPHSILSATPPSGNVRVREDCGRKITKARKD